MELENGFLLIFSPLCAKISNLKSHVNDDISDFSSQFYFLSNEQLSTVNFKNFHLLRSIYKKNCKDVPSKSDSALIYLININGIFFIQMITYIFFISIRNYFTKLTI